MLDPMDQFKEFFESAPDAFVVIDSSGKIISVNTQAEKLFGYTRAELIGQLNEVLMPERFRSRHVALRQSYSEKPQARPMGIGKELCALRKDNSEIPVEISLSPIKTENGLVVFSAIRDLSNRKKLENDLSEALKERDLFFHSSLDLLCIAKPDGYFAMVNPAFCHIAGYTNEEILSRPFISLAHPEDVSKIMHAIDNVSAGIPILDFESRLVPKEGSYRWISWKVVLVKNHFYASGRDITDKKLYEDSLRANKMKSQFLANMSHELRTPLNSVIGFSEFLVDEKPGQLNPKQKEYLLDILSSGQHLLQLINDILDLSKVEAGKMQLCCREFSVPELIQEVSCLMDPGIQKKNLTLKLTLSPDVGQVVLDEQKIKQILYNLLSNAVKFTPEKGEIEILASILDQDELQIQIKDNGIGIKKEDMGRLFVEFEQLDSGETRQFQGTGLGLALVKKLLMLLGGTISVDSTFGKGSTFTIKVPMRLEK